MCRSRLPHGSPHQCWSGKSSLDGYETRHNPQIEYASFDPDEELLDAEFDEVEVEAYEPGTETIGYGSKWRHFAPLTDEEQEL